MSEQVSKAQRRTITIGKIPLEVAMLPNGSYVFSQSEVARVVERPEISIRRFSRSEWLKSIVGLHSKPDPLPTEGANRPIAPVSPEVAALYWQKCASQGNQKAQALVVAIIKRSLYDFADEAFGVKRGSSGGADADADDLLSEELVQIETMYQSLSYQECGAAASDIEQLNLKIRLAELELERERLQGTQTKWTAFKHLPCGVPETTMQMKAVHFVRVFRRGYSIAKNKTSFPLLTSTKLESHRGRFCSGLRELWVGQTTMRRANYLVA